MGTILVKLSRFTGDAVGLEKSMRFLQGLSQVMAATAISTLAASPWHQARKQFALGRRYLRFLKFIDTFRNAYKSFNSQTGLVGILEVGKWSFLGAYFLGESAGILDAMGVWNTTWASGLFIEASKFWFYSLCLSVMLDIIELYRLSASSRIVSTEAEKDDEKVREKVKKTEAVMQAKLEKRRSIMRRLGMDCCDLFIPGSTVGWLTVSSTTVGSMMMISTLLGSVDVWARVQNGGG